MKNKLNWVWLIVLLVAVLILALPYFSRPQGILPKPVYNVVITNLNAIDAKLDTTIAKVDTTKKQVEVLQDSVALITKALHARERWFGKTSPQTSGDWATETQHPHISESKAAMMLLELMLETLLM